MRGYNMRVHIERVHNKNKPWQCQFCEKTFATTSDLKQHLSSHGMGKIHKCEDCGREFSNRDSAILHRKQHNNERTHFCQDCGKGFFKASCLQVNDREVIPRQESSDFFCLLATHEIPHRRETLQLRVLWTRLLSGDHAQES